MNTAPLLQNGVFDLVSQSGLVAKCVLVVLLAASILSWGIIVSKWHSLKSAARENAKFLQAFWAGKNIEDVFAKSEKFNHSPIAKVFKSGFKELQKLTEGEARIPETNGSVENIQRALMRASSVEIASMERYVSWLATTASAAPFIGLFGTVWGIMNSFQNIGATGAANLSVVAPGISEALITTATGIATAVPAVIAYNQIVGYIKRMAIDVDCFSHDFLNIVQRGLLGEKSKKGI